MGVDLNRVRTGELLAGVGGGVLLVDLFLVKWFGHHEQTRGARIPTSVLPDVNGWHSLDNTRWLLLLTALAALALVYLTARHRAPALPVAASVIATVLGALATLFVLYRVIDHPADGLTAQVGLFLGLVAAAAVFAGGYLAMRDEQGARPAGAPARLIPLAAVEGGVGVIGSDPTPPPPPATDPAPPPPAPPAEPPAPQPPAEPPVQPGAPDAPVTS
jgi:hypothetical protein